MRFEVCCFDWGTFPKHPNQKNAGQLSDNGESRFTCLGFTVPDVDLLTKPTFSSSMDDGRQLNWVIRVVIFPTF
jgi:hypothetical protein